jgi:hypothetical protein
VAGCLGVATVPVTDGYLHLVIGMVVLATGMGLVMAPATESIMGSLPRSKAGVGSAMNDTTRQMGGALGVAVIGSVLASAYRPGVTSALRRAGAPADVVNDARESIGGAVEAADRLTGSLHDTVLRLARSEFVDAFHSAVLVSAGVLLLAAIVAFAFLPARAHDHVEEGEAGAGAGLALEAEVEALASLAAAEADAALVAD